MRSEASGRTDRRLFIQARMTSARFPGKVLAPFRGRPVIASVVERAAGAVGADNVVVATSDDPSDDPLDAYVRRLGIAVFRGALDDVLGRLQSCLEAYPCGWFCRVCADSPLLDPDLVRGMMAHTDRNDLDLVTNVFPRTFPRGQSVEWIASERFAAIRRDDLTATAREHVTTVYYEAPERFRILNVTSDGQGRGLDVCVDTVDDLRRLERLGSEA